MFHTEDPQVFGPHRKKKCFLSWRSHAHDLYTPVLDINAYWRENHTSPSLKTQREALREIEQMENGEREREKEEKERGGFKAQMINCNSSVA